MEIRYAKHIQRKQKLLVFCVTKSQPPIYWLPRAADEQTEALLQEHAASFEEWKQQQLQQLEADKAELAAKIAARKEASAAYASRGGRQQGDGVAEQDTEDVGLEEGDVDGADVGDQQGLQNEAAELDDQAQVELDGKCATRNSWSMPTACCVGLSVLLAVHKRFSHPCMSCH